MGQARTVLDTAGQPVAPGAVSITEAARRLGRSRSTLYAYLAQAEREGHPGRIRWQRGGETVDLVCVAGPFGKWMVTNASLHAVLG